MKNSLESLASFHCPRWHELPNQPIFNHQLVDYINQALEAILDENERLTQTMVQNYSKWDAIPKLTGRKYRREQISIIMIILIYKQVINISDIKEGVDLQLNLTSIEEGYNIFARTLEEALHEVFNSSLGREKLVLKEKVMEEKEEGVRLIAHAFALRLLVKKIIEKGGYKNLGETKE